MDINKKITELREAKGWSQYRLAKESGVKQGNISQLEAGIKKPTAETLAKLCSALGVSMSEFDSNNNDIKLVLSRADHLNLSPEQKRTYEKLKAMPIDEQQTRLYDAMEHFKKLSEEQQKALLVIIRSLRQ